jgi:hypothetical protein
MPGRRSFSLALLAGVLAAAAVSAVSASAGAADGVLVTFTAGTGDAPGKITVTNAGNGSTTSVGLAPRLPASACAEILATAAPKVGLKVELSGSAVKFFSRSAIVKVEGATMTKSEP